MYIISYPFFDTFYVELENYLYSNPQMIQSYIFAHSTDENNGKVMVKFNINCEEEDLILIKLMFPKITIS